MGITRKLVGITVFYAVINDEDLQYTEKSTKNKVKKKKKKKKTNHKSLTQGFAEQNPSKILNFHEYNRCSR